MEKVKKKNYVYLYFYMLSVQMNWDLVSETNRLFLKIDYNGDIV